MANKITTPPMDFESGNISENWKRWQQTMELVIQGPLAGKNEKQQVGYFLLHVGQTGRDIYNTWTLTDDETDKLQPLYDKFTAYCNPKKNVTVARYRFNTRTQAEGETVDQFVTELRRLAKDCNYGNLEAEMLRDRIVCGTNNSTTKEKLLQEDDVNLERAIDIARGIEISRVQMRDINPESSDKSVHFVNRGKKSDYSQYRKPSGYSGSEKQGGASGGGTAEQCKQCGRSHSRSDTCPAKGRRCLKCKRFNHFAVMCKSQTKHVSEIKEEYREDYNDDYPGNDESAFCIGTIAQDSVSTDDEAYVSIQVNQDKSIQMKLDTGAQVNVMSLQDFDKVRAGVPLHPVSEVQLRGYGGHKLSVIGKCKLHCQYKDQQGHFDFYVVETTSPPALSLKTCTALNLIQLVLDVHTINTETAKLIDDYSDIFTGIGQLPGVYHISLDSEVKPVVHAARKVPVALRDQVKTELEKMVEDDVIVKVDEPTEWVNSMVVTLKPNGKIRLCLDPRDLNRAIQREHYAMPTLDSVTDNLANQKVFTVCDAKSGYWHVPLDSESSRLTTFNTPWGRYRYTRMPFGIKSAQEVFQKRLDEVLEGLEGVYNIVDDVLVTGSTVEEHDRRLFALLDRMRESGVTLNPDKLQLRQQEVKYFGEILSATGMKPDPTKIEAIKNMPPPTNKKELECDLGMFTYLAQYAPHLSDKTTAMRELLKNDVEWQWCPEHDRDFAAIKELITREPGPVLRYYNAREPVVLQVDASQTGMGAVLLQEGKPVAYASRALTPTQERYAQIEKEMLAIVFGCERFHQYLYGRDFVVQSDHKPLESIMAKPLHAVPLRLQKMRLRLQWYNPTVTWVPGKQIPVADALSRRYVTHTGTTTSDDVEAHVHMILANKSVTINKLEQIRQETEQDQDLQTLVRVIMDGWPEKQTKLSAPARDHWNHRDEMTVIDNIVYKGEQIVIPKALRQEMLEKIHVGHMGMEKSKQRARELIFWPGMYKDIDNMVAMCDVCLEHRNAQCKEPMISHPIPERPWQVVATDLFQWNNQQYLLVVDYLSRYFEIAQLSSTTSSSVITHTKSIFARHGIPETVISDNGPQYSAEEYGIFAREWGFDHKTSSPRYPQSNGLAEKTVQTVKGLLQKSKQSGQDPYLALLNYRSTPVDGNASPSQMLMMRRIRTRLPTTGRQLLPKLMASKWVKRQRSACQNRQKYAYDRSAKPLLPLNEGDSVRVQRNGVWKPATVVKEAETPRSYWIRTPDGAQYRRNSRDLLRTQELPVRARPLVTPNVYTPPVPTTTTTEMPSMPQAATRDSPTPPMSTARQAPAPCERADTPAGPVVTRYGRVVKPKTYPDFVKS